MIYIYIGLGIMVDEMRLFLMLWNLYNPKDVENLERKEGWKKMEGIEAVI